MQIVGYKTHHSETVSININGPQGRFFMENILSPNKEFKLEVDDIALIESALFEKLSNSKFNAERRTINELLGKLHDQKVWYRPNSGVYVSG